MSKFFEPIGMCARQFANIAEPAIIAFSVAGLTGGTLATLGILAEHARGRGSARTLAADDVTCGGEA